MKRILLIITMLALTVIIAACGQSNDGDNANKTEDDVTNNEDQNTDDQNDTGTDTDNENTNDDAATESNSSDDMQQKMDNLDYVDFELGVDYADDKEYEAELENDTNGIDAKLDDELNGVNISGEDAFNDIYPNVEKLTINQGTNKEDAIKQILEAFDLPSDYLEFDLELKFQDGTKLEFKDEK